MKGNKKAKLLRCVFCVVFSLVLVFQYNYITQGSTDKKILQLYDIINPYEMVDWEVFGQYKGNLHTHTTQSDGHLSPSEVIDLYKKEGYQILSITDHDKVTYPWQKYGREPEELDMVDIQGNEISKGHHFGSFFNDYSGTTRSEEYALADIEKRNGLGVLFHPGRYDKGLKWYTRLYGMYDSLIGIEVINRKDRYRDDRKLWDDLLTEFMPVRQVWGFANDDFHRTGHLGSSWNVFVLPELTREAVREAMEGGYFYFSSVAEAEVVNGKPPKISLIEVDKKKGSISITADEYEEIIWISEGRHVYTGNKFEYTRAADTDKYVRAVITGPGGQTFTQPFGIIPYESGKLKDLSVSEGTLNTNFRPGIHEYILNIPGEVEYITVNPESFDKGASISVNGATQADITRAFKIYTAIDDIISINVMSANERQSSEYTIRINRVDNILPSGSLWKYMDNGSDQGEEWTGSQFDDSNWKTGPAILGYGGYFSQQTLISYGADKGNKHIATFFRHEFEVEYPSVYKELYAGILRDDGAVVYLNGREVFRSNMPSGEITYKTTALNTIDKDINYYDFFINPELLTPGKNILAVSLHQVNGTSSDLAFDFRLEGTIKDSKLEKVVLDTDKVALNLGESSHIKVKGINTNGDDVDISMEEIKTLYRTSHTELIEVYNQGIVTLVKHPGSVERVKVWADVYINGTLFQSNRVPITLNSPEETKPNMSIFIKLPEANGQYLLNEAVYADWIVESDSEIKEVSGSVLNGNLIDTSTPGRKTFTVGIKDIYDNERTETITYYVLDNKMAETIPDSQTYIDYEPDRSEDVESYRDYDLDKYDEIIEQVETNDDVAEQKPDEIQQTTDHKVEKQPNDEMDDVSTLKVDQPENDKKWLSVLATFCLSITLIIKKIYFTP